jgi:hypothetical protein
LNSTRWASKIGALSHPALSALSIHSSIEGERKKQYVKKLKRFSGQPAIGLDRSVIYVLKLKIVLGISLEILEFLDFRSLRWDLSIIGATYKARRGGEQGPGV